jgi:hyperosmotically inducible protein
MSDQQSVDAALAGNPRLHADEIAAQVLPGGEVLLRGTVGSLAEAEDAARTARDVPGVRDVDNRLRVRLFGTNDRDDAVIQAAVLTALIRDGEIRSINVTVTADDGIVTLAGEVTSEAQRSRAERIALDTPGVVDVRAELEIRPR